MLVTGSRLPFHSSVRQIKRRSAHDLAHHDGAMWVEPDHGVGLLPFSSRTAL
jgi:hypothetical protein